MTLTRWQPARELDAVQKNIRRMFEDFDRTFSNLGAPQTNPTNFLPRVDINEDAQNLYIQAELPGLTEDEVKITLSEGVLTLRGEKKRSEGHKDRNHYRLERSFGEFVRQFALPEDIKEDEIEAKFTNGVLDVVIPKAEPVKPKEREVQIKRGETARIANEQDGGNVEINSKGKLERKENIPVSSN